MNDIAFQKILANVMLDNKYDRFVKNRKTGKLDTKSLFKINTSDKLFKRREARQNKFYSVLLLVDTSGSMCGSKVAMAASSAEDLSYHLSKIGISNAIYTFSSGVTEVKPFNTKIIKKGQIRKKIEDELDEGQIYYLFEGSICRVKNKNTKQKMQKFLGKGTHLELVALKEKLNKEKINYIAVNGSGYNSDAEAIKKAREIILKQQGKKLLIVLSDGYPQPLPSHYESPIFKEESQVDFDLKKEVNMTIAKGVEVYSIGVLSDAVKAFYPTKRTCAVNDIKQVYPHIIQLVRLNLKRG